MKKIGILNFQYSTHNYGAVLQAAALEYICRQLGHDPRHLDYMAQRKMTLKGRVAQILRKLGLKLGLKKAPTNNQVFNQAVFEQFRTLFLNRTPRIKAERDFTEVAKSFDSVIVGSDQVWRPAYAKDTIAFFLGYVPKGVDRISYAASFGTETWQETDDTHLTSKVQNELRNFRAISCREESGVKICNDIFGVDAVHVLDPLLLVEDPFFDKISAKSSVGKDAKLVYYKLDSSADFQDDLAVVGAMLGSPAVNIYLKDSAVREYREVWDWVSLIRNADTVITDSFHCICLALRFGKDVIFCPNERRGQTRLDSLFKKLNIDKEPITGNLKTPMFKLHRRGDIGAILETERAHSMQFLREALQ